MYLFSNKDYKTYNEFVEMLYKVKNIKEFQEILTKYLPRLIPYDSSILLFLGDKSNRVESGIIENLNPALFSQYRDYYQKFDEYKKIVHELPNPPVVNRASEFLDYKEWRKNEHRNDFLLPQGVYHIACLEIIRNDKIITSFSFHRNKKHPDFSDRELNIFYILAPVIKNVYLTLTFDYLNNLSIYNDLTIREKQILPLLFSKYSNDELALNFGITKKTLKTHIRNILRKMDCSSRSDLLFKFGNLQKFI